MRRISSTNDLFNINTLGFRGEALASIAAVSQLLIITKQKDMEEGFNLVVEGGQNISAGILAAQQGTIIEVKNIFFNTPARKKFLKTDQVELRHIIDVITRYALINPSVTFKLTHDNHELLNSPGVKNWRDCISSVYGKKLAKELLEINYFNEEEMIKITGYIAKPYQARNDKSQQNIFVNGRWVKNDTVSEAIYDAYHSLLFVNKHPIFILNIELNPEEVDVNVHPTKQEIKFGHKKVVQNNIFTAIKETLQKHNLIPVMDLDNEEQLSFGTSTNIKKEKKEEKQKHSYEKSEQKSLDVAELDEKEVPSPFTSPIETDSENSQHNITESTETFSESDNFNLPPMRLIGQLHKTFFVAETENGILFIDQHVVQERVLYEKFMEQMMNQHVEIQSLLQPEMIELFPGDKNFVEEAQDKLKEFGFLVEEFEGNTFILKTVPAVFGRIQPKDLFYEMLESMKSGKNKLEEVQEEIITRMACRASVKSGDTLTITEMNKLLDELKETKLPYTCPHGRAVLIKITTDELEKKFKRK